MFSPFTDVEEDGDDGEDYETAITATGMVMKMVMMMVVVTGGM